MTPSHPHRRRVALALPAGIPFLERLLRGVMEYARQAGGWSVVRLPEFYGSQLGWLRQWSGDGALVLITSSAEARAARSLSLPLVNLASHLADPGLPTVTVDHARIGRLAAEHLLERRFRRCAYYGVRSLRFSELRREAFVARITAAGGCCQVFEAPSALRAATVDGHLAALDRWLSGLERPVGILASNDLRAGMVLDACRRLGIRVPDELAVLGVDDDPAVCLYADPPLSSVARNDEEVGRSAARLLDRLMRTTRNRLRNTAPATVLIPPAGVVARRSTAAHAIAHPLLATLVQDLAARLHEPFGVEGLLARQPRSRRRMEALFQEHLGCSPYQYILRQRIERARLLIDEQPGLSLTAIARQCGFTDLRHLRRAFVRQIGHAPAAHRAARR